ncbi:hypothetical protein, partial [Klebsiella quasipneumoniae]|uniref:hypothetical protein n=1 Tax=Klebsiella quasipneumoniae TaxID=1463165 RepID=UPI0027DF453D
MPTMTPHTPATSFNTKKSLSTFLSLKPSFGRSLFLEQKTWPNLTRLWERRRLKYSWITSSEPTNW